MTGLANFRDFGGMSSADGGVVRQDRLYRSAAPRHASAEQLQHLLGLDFALVADLRYAGERTDEPSSWPADYGDRVFHHDADTSQEAPHLAPLRQGTMDIATSARIYEDLYRALPYDPFYRPLFAEILKRLADTDGRLLIHCSAGKDRTGMAVALIHHALGVPRDAIMTEFLRSSRDPGLLAMAGPIVANVRKRHGMVLPIEVAEHMLDVHASYLDAFFEEIEQRDDSIDLYLDRQGVDAALRSRLRDRLLVD